VGDNRYNNPEYTKVLEGLTGWQKRAWLDGDWDIAAGQFFTTFRRDVHVVGDFKSDRESPFRRRMSGEFEVSVRTLKRDIEFMKNSLALPIEFDVQKNGYYFASPQPQFPRVPLTEAEVVGLFVAQKSIAQYQGTALQPRSGARTQARRRLVEGKKRLDHALSARSSSAVRAGPRMH
jgi:hypothetical protein